MTQQHIPVLASEVLAGLSLSAHETVIDGTLGLGGHAQLILAAIAPDGQLVGFDRDGRNLETARQNLASYADRIRLIHDSFGNMDAYGVEADAILLDLGFSSVHVDDADRGFSFMHDGPLDMRYDTRQEITAADVVNGWSRDDLAMIFRKWGEEPRAAQAAKAIFDARRADRIVTTTQLADVISAVIPRTGKMHPATRVFQALRIAVNDELGEVERGLRAAVKVLKPGGRLAVITFHSIEDRLVKQFFKDEAQLDVLTKKPVVATREEEVANPRSRSAKLRVAKKLS